MWTEVCYKIQIEEKLKLGVKVEEVGGERRAREPSRGQNSMEKLNKEESSHKFHGDWAREVENESRERREQRNAQPGEALENTQGSWEGQTMSMIKQQMMLHK